MSYTNTSVIIAKIYTSRQSPEAEEIRHEKRGKPKGSAGCFEAENAIGCFKSARLQATPALY